MKAQIETITPKIAEQILSANTRNRPLSPATVGKYAADMAAGRWTLNGEPIIVASDGTLLDGQHRLHAVVSVSATVRALVVRGVEPGAFVTMGAGRTRTAADVLAISGFAHSNVMAAAARLALNFTSGRQLGETTTRVEVTNFATANPHLAEIAKAAQNARTRLTTSPLAAVLFLASRKRFFDNEVADFLEGVSDGHSMEKGDPRLTLREWATNERLRARGTIQTVACFGAVARAWTAFVRGEDLLQIKLMRSPHRDSTTIAGFSYEPQVADIAPAKLRNPVRARSRANGSAALLAAE